MNKETTASIVTFAILVLLFSSCSGQQASEFTDARDGQSYRFTVLPNGSKWMISDLNFKTPSSICDEKDADCQYGRYYSWNEVGNACPEGWALPTKLEWQYVLSTYGCCNPDGPSTMKEYTPEYYGKINTSPKEDGSPRTSGFWTDSKSSANKAWSILMVEDDEGFYWYKTKETPALDQPVGKCRCIQRPSNSNQVSMPTIDKETGDSLFVDARDGKMYTYNKLEDGNIWMTQNLNYEMEGSFCYQDNCAFAGGFGRLYNWEAATQACPPGWHLPSDEEWLALIEAYGGGYRDFNTEETIGDALKTYHNLVFDASPKFNPKFGGFLDVCNDYTEYRHLGNIAGYWSNSPSSAISKFCGGAKEAWNYQFSMKRNVIRRADSPVGMGRSCRCIKD
jgi:uncharacterized protein (TIGR02145 family)